MITLSQNQSAADRAAVIGGLVGGDMPAGWDGTGFGACEPRIVAVVATADASGRVREVKEIPLPPAVVAEFRAAHADVIAALRASFEATLIAKGIISGTLA